MTVTELKKTLQNQDFKKVYLFYGDEKYLIFNYINQLKNLLLGEMSEFNYFEFEGDTQLNTVVEAIDQLPQMSDKKLIILKDSGLVNKNDKSVIKMINDIPPYNTVVFVERDSKKINKKILSEIEKEGAAVSFSTQKPSDLRAWLNIRLGHEGKRMRNDDIEHLIQICELSMARIELEMDKLIASVGDRDEINRSDIKRMVTPLLDFKIYEMTDSVLKNDTQTAYEALREFKSSNEPPTAILSMLFTQLNFIAMVKNLKMDGERRLDEFFPQNRKFLARRIAKDTDKYNLSSLYSAMQLCAHFDADIKMGRIDGWTAVEIVIANLLAKPA